MIKKKLDELIDKLTSSTESGKVEWERTSSKNEYQTKIGENAVSVGYYDPNDLVNLVTINLNSVNKSYYYLSIYNSQGVAVDYEERFWGDSNYDKLKDLYQIAKRKYYKVDETLDDIIKELGQ